MEKTQRSAEKDKSKCIQYMSQHHKFEIQSMSAREIFVKCKCLEWRLDKEFVRNSLCKIRAKRIYAFKARCPGTSNHQNKNGAVLIFFWQGQNPECSPELPSTRGMLTNWTDFREPQQKWLRAGAIDLWGKMKRTDYVLLTQTNKQ